jgi:hypothetical protein
MDQDSMRMSAEGFGAALDRLGPSLERWPAAEREAAERLLATDAAARRMLRAAASVDGTLRRLMQDDGAILVPVATRRAAPAPSFGRLAAWGTLALAASLAIGIFAGALSPAPDDDDDTAGQIFLAVQDSDSGDYL